VTDIKIMSIDLAVWSADPATSDATEPNDRVEIVQPLEFAAPSIPPLGQRVVIVRRQSARDALLAAEWRNAPEHEVHLLEEASIAASMARVRAVLREGGTVTTGQRRQFERDCELMRRFPDDRRGIGGEGWFHLHH